MKCAVYNQQGEETGETLLPKGIFEVKENKDLLWQAVRAYMANSRLGRPHTKTRGQVRGGGRKPWRQKGTGRARASSIRSPLWRGGGAVFGPNKDKNYKQKINKKTRRLALLMALSTKARDKQIFIIEDLKIKSGKTKEMAEIVDILRSKIGFLAKGKILVAISESQEKVLRAAKNIPGFTIIEVRNLNPKEVISCKSLLMTKNAVTVLKKTFSGKKEAE